MSQHWIIRVENVADYDLTDRIIVAASGETETAQLVRRLRSDGDVILSLVAQMGSYLIGHIMMSRVSIETTDGNLPGVALAPLMVDPAYQNIGVGSSLTRASLEGCRVGGDRIVLVVGHPTYYPRFGFAADLAKHLQNPFELEVPGAFMALELQPSALCGIRGRVRYNKSAVRHLGCAQETKSGGFPRLKRFVYRPDVRRSGFTTNGLWNAAC
jgi:putative acetyltransferase